jgi:acetoin utilization deacetylase AcuC-like enzyme
MLVVVGPLEAEEHVRAHHPERPARIGAVEDGIADLHLESDAVFLASRPAERSELVAVHSASHLDALARACSDGVAALDVDTYLTPASWEAALCSAGAGLVAAEALRDGAGDLAFVATRPPGHHATARQAMGFCLLNNVAVTASQLVDRGERVLIVDWDVHHGNGTQDVFWNSPEVLYVSTHQWPCYPGTGDPREVGGPDAPGATLNIPLPPGATGDVVLAAFDQVIAPAVDRFAPTWVLVSAGFDAHRSDPLADLSLSAGDFAALATRVADFAPAAGRIILFLEGGYDLGALRSSVAATLGALVEAPQSAEPPTAGGPGGDQVRSAGDIRTQLLG